MNCPTDGTTLLMSERHGVEIDYCPQCRGVWLDRGELDKILERVQTDTPSAAAVQPPAYREEPAPQPRYQEPRYDDRRDSRYSGDKHRKKSSPFEFLGDIFG